MIDSHPYTGRTVVLATMHGKETAIAPPFRELLGLEVLRASGIDTDQLGTFTGERPRPGSMLETAKAKAELGLTGTGEQLGLASEGSFGPHPVIPFMAGGVELILFVDRERGLAISETMPSPATNFAHRLVSGDEDCGDFLAHVGFPSHALVVSPNEASERWFEKGIRDYDALRRAIALAVLDSADGRALVQTDMRAHMNPTRMQSLQVLARRLAARLARLCPACNGPGFGRVDVERGLPCEACDTPTEGILNEIAGCSSCAYRHRVARRDGLTRAPQAQCPRCNP